MDTKTAADIRRAQSEYFRSPLAALNQRLNAGIPTSRKSVMGAKMVERPEISPLEALSPKLAGLLEGASGFGYFGGSPSDVSPSGGGSVLDPAYMKRKAEMQEGAEYGYPIGTALALPFGGKQLGQAASALGNLAKSEAGYKLAQKALDSPMLLGAASPMNVIKNKGGNWLTGDIPSTLKPLRRTPDWMSGEMINEASGDWGLWDKIVAENGHRNPHEWMRKNRPDVYAKMLGEEGTALNQWIDKKLAKYVQNEMGTPEDPLRALAERGISHQPLYEGMSASPGTRKDRLEAGFSAEGFAQSPLAEQWEATADNAIRSRSAGMRVRQGEMPNAFRTASLDLERNPWLRDLAPNTPTYELVGSFDNAQFDHLVDELHNVIREGSDLPQALRWTPSDLSKVTVPQAVERLAAVNKYRQEEEAVANQQKANNSATFLHKEYPGQPFKWVEFKKPEVTELPPGYSISELPNKPGWFAVMDKNGRSTGGVGKTPEEAFKNHDFGKNILQDALDYEGSTMGHCVGGYCPEVASGKHRIFSLRDESGMPHATIETVKEDFHPIGYGWKGGQQTRDAFPEDFTYTFGLDKKLPPDQHAAVYNRAKELYGKKIEGMDPANTSTLPFDISRMEAFQQAATEVMGPSPDFINQIKGSGKKDRRQDLRLGTDTKPGPDDHLLPYIQDFVKSGTWNGVNDLHNAGLFDTTDQNEMLRLLQRVSPERNIEQGVANFYNAHSQLPDRPRFMTSREIEDILSPPAEGLARGGLVYNPAKVDELVARHYGTEYDPAKVNAIVNSLKEEMYG